jgi:hypothetical protein
VRSRQENERQVQEMVRQPFVQEEALIAALFLPAKEGVSD